MICRPFSLILLCLSNSSGSQVKLKTDQNLCPLLDGVFVSIMRRIFNPGYHKELLSEVEIMLTTTLLPDRCSLLVEETIPRGAYVDQDQIRDLRYKVGLRAFIPTKVDIEKPEFESEAFRVFLFRPLRVQENLRVTTIQLPVHMRYHKPAPPPAVASVKINNPRILLSCQEEDIVSNCTDRRVISYCDETGTSKCDWLNLPYKINVANIEVTIPVGNSEQGSLVVAVTTLVTCGATIYLIITITRKVKIKTE